VLHALGRPAERGGLDELGVGHQRTDLVAAVGGRALRLELGQPADVDERVGARQAQLEERQQALAAGDDLRPAGHVGQGPQRLVDRSRALVLECRRDHAWPPFAPWMARHTVCEVYGMSRCRMPSGLRASTTAFATAAVLAIAPASPTPLTPIGLTAWGDRLVELDQGRTTPEHRVVEHRARQQLSWSS
jgi:hypothetical protein